MEMNLFAPQSEQTQLEIANIADVKRQIITPRYSKPIIKFKQDTVLGTFKMTEKTKKINYMDAMNLAMYSNNVDIFTIKKETTTTHKLYSLIIPPLINYTDSKVNITDGHLLNGVMGDSVLNQKIVYYSWDRHGPDVTKNFFDNAQRLVTNWLLMNGFSVGLADATTDQHIIDNVKYFCEVKQMEVDKLITEMENNPETLDPETFETNLLSTLKMSDGEISKQIYEHLKTKDSGNNFYGMIEPKAKGSPGNIAQIIGGLGQNVLDMKRIKKKVNNRTLPHFFQNDDRALARGFIPNSYYHGLTPKEFFIHHMTAREGMIDTAIKSVIGSTPIIILENNKIQHIKIGDWIDKLMTENQSKIIANNSNDEYKELLQIDHNVTMPTINFHGNLIWDNIVYVTRHKPSTIMYKIKTKFGRIVTVTDSHSLLIWNKEKFILEQKSATYVNIGDYVPITLKLHDPNNIVNTDVKYNLDIPFNSIEERDMAIFKLNLKNEFVKINELNELKLDYMSKDELFIINNIVLDPIIQIEQIDGSIYSKVYDIAIPSTLNFCLANGLHVVDTADSGYLQRKLIKGMEDVMMAYDKTIRSGNNVIIQMIYGDNNINQTHYKEIDIRIVLMSNTLIKSEFSFDRVQSDNLCTEFGLDKKKFAKFDTEYCQTLINFRDELRQIQMISMMNYITVLDKYKLPVNLPTFIDDAKNAVISTKAERLNPLYVVHAINYILNHNVTRVGLVAKGDIKKSLKNGDQSRAKYLFRIALFEYLAPKKCIFDYKLTKSQFDQMVVDIIESFKKASVEPGEMVGILSAQSLGETLTQMTLNSVSWEDQIFYTDNNNIYKVDKIGSMIDNLMEKNKDHVINVDTGSQTEFLDISDMNLKIQSLDENGKLHWKLIEAVTRHLPNGNVVKVKTQTGREVVATRSKSFLLRRNNKIVPVKGAEIQIGDRLPIQMKAPRLDNYLNELDLNMYLPKNEYIYGSEIQKAINYRDTCGKKTWFLDGRNNNVFETPYNKSDLLVDGTKRNPYLLTSNVIIPIANAACSSKLTEKIILDEICGFFFGAYLAEGTISHAQVIISNNDINYRNKIAEFANRYEIKYHTQIQHNKNFTGATSSDIRLHSTMMVKIIQNSCGKYSDKKYIPNWAFGANDNFVKGLLDGYFSGNGTVNKCDTYITISSASKQLLIGISELLTRFGIICKLSQHIVTNNNIGSKNIKPVNTLSIRNKNVNLFAEKIGFSIQSKQEIAEQSYAINWTTNNGRRDIIPGINIEHLNGSYHRNELENIYNTTTDNQVKEKLEAILNEDVYYDEIISIEELSLDEITPEHSKVYDLTVADTRNFNMFGGLCMRDTFHSSGVGVKGMQGIPRFREILSYSKKISTPCMMIKLIPEIRSNHNIAHKVEAYLKHTIFKNLVERMDIIFDPIPTNIIQKDHINATNIYYIGGGSTGIENLPWLFKFTIGRESMLENDITLLDIKTKFIKYWEEYSSDSTASKKKIILNKITNGCIMSNFDNSEIPIIHIRFDISNPDNSSLIDIGNYMLNKISIKGVATIDKVDRIEKQKVIEYDSDGGIISTAHEWVIYTEGIDLNKIKSIKQIDFNTLYINDIHQAYLNFGIEAARSLIIREADTLYNGSGNPINVTHVALLADVMTNTGTITSIDRHGINRLDTDPLSRASFEKTVEQLITASAFNEVDYMRSVSSRIMAGRCFKGGTGMCDILLDNELIENSEYDTNVKSFIETSNVQLEENSLLKDIITNKSDADIDIFLP